MQKLTRASQKLVAFLDGSKADGETMRRLAQGELRFMDRVDYAKKDIGNLSGSTNLIDESLSKLDGTRSIHQGRLPQSQYACYDKVLVTFESTASTDSLPQADALYSPDMTSFDPALRNALLVVRQDDKVKLELPISTLAAFADSDKNPKEVAYELNDPVVLEPGKLIEWEIKFPSGQTVDNTAATSHNVEVQFFGIGTAPRS